jgi:hypothetical protein
MVINCCFSGDKERPYLGYVEAFPQYVSYSTFRHNELAPIELGQTSNQEYSLMEQDTKQDVNSDTASLIPFLRWMECELIQQNKPTKSMKIAGATGLMVGLLAACVSFPLAGNFGILVVEAMGSRNSAANTLAYILCGVNAAIPSMALNSVATRSQFQRLVSSSSLESTLLLPSNTLKFLNNLSHFLCFFSAMSPCYVGYLVSEGFPWPVRILFMGPAYIGCYMFTVGSQKRLSKSLVHSLEQKNETMPKRQRIQESLIKSMKMISTMQKEDFDDVYNKFFTVLETQATEDSYQSRLRKIKSLLDIGKESEELTPRSNCNINGKKLVGVLGSIIGTAETYLAFSLVEEATDVLCNSIGIYDPATKSVLGKTFGSLACIPWGALYIEGVKGRFTRIYDSVFNKSRSYQKEFVSLPVNTCISRFAIWGGVSAAIPSVYLSLQTTKTLPLGLRIILGGAIFLCPSTVLTEALEIMLNQGWGWVKSFRTDSLEFHKEKLIQAMRSIYLKIDEMPDSIIDSLDNELFDIA